MDLLEIHKSYKEGILNVNMDDIFETSYWKVMLADNQDYLGRCVVILKRKCGDLAELKSEEIVDFLKIVKKTEHAIRKAFSATMFNWTCLMNNAYKKQIPKPQVHWHLRPRYRHKVDFAGTVFEDKEFGHHYSRENEKKLTKVIRDKIINEIVRNL